MTLGDRPNPSHLVPAGSTIIADSLLSKIEPSKIVDLIISKQMQYYTLWGVYTAVQFAAGGFGFSVKPLPLAVGLAVLLGVWAFNLGHLGFVLRCVDQLNKLTAVLNAAIEDKKPKYELELKAAFENMLEGSHFWHFLGRSGHPRSYGWNIFVHFWIDVCASAALLVRVDSPWIQRHLPEFLRGIS